MKHIYVDFNTMMTDERGRVSIASRSHPEWLCKLEEGERVVLFDETMEVEAIVEYEEDLGELLGVADWSTRVALAITDEPGDEERKNLDDEPET